MKGWKKIFHANGDQEKAGVAILISDKIDCEIKAVKRDKEGRTLHNDQRINPRGRYNNYKYICTQHRSTTICKVLTSMKREISSNTVIVGDFTTPLTLIHLCIDQLNRKLTRNHKL